MGRRIVVVGTGWAGYTLAHEIDTKRFDVSIVSPEPTTPYTPLLASAACGLFNFSLAEEPIRHKSKNIHFYQARVTDIDFDRKVCICQPAFESLQHRVFELEYDDVVIGAGCTNQTFGTPGVAEHALFVRTVRDAMAVRARLQDVIEMASLPGMTDAEQRALLHIVIVGGGPTGVEMAAEMADLIQDDFTALYADLRGKFSIAIHDVASRVLSVFDEKLCEHALADFKRTGVEIKAGSHITQVGPGLLHTEEDGEIRFGLLVWATGNKQVPLIDTLKLAKSQKLPRILTNEYLQPLDACGEAVQNAYALGDCADIKGGELPTTAEVACQKAAYLAKAFDKDLKTPFTYDNRALITYTGAHDGVVAGNTNWSGPGAWLAWRSKNLSWASGSWRNKILIVMNWSLNRVFGKEIARA